MLNKMLKLKAAFHVLADHIRSSTIIIADGGALQMKAAGMYYVKLFAALHYLRKN